MFGKVVLITGSTDGIGRHTAFKLAKMGATVIIHGRSADRVRDTCAAIRRENKNTNNVDGFVADFSSMDAVRRLSTDLHSRYKAIDILINNAGVFGPPVQTSDDGYEMTFAVNVLAQYLLTALTMDLLMSSAHPPARLIFVSSISQATSGIRWDKLVKGGPGFGEYETYNASKSCVAMLTYYLATRIDTTKITVNTLDPGTVNTKMLLASFGPCGIDIEDANDELWMATDQSFNTVNGKYFVGCHVSRTAKCTYDTTEQQKLWALCVDLTKTEFPSI
jgi:NAD(P)-dependent dehydrogenase (short-subunit alcohol dehydrogenase family)